MQAGGETFSSEIHQLINSVWDKKGLPQQWKRSIIVPIYKKVKHTVEIIEAYHCYKLHKQFCTLFEEHTVSQFFFPKK
jgi:hypothetical protein